ncbi:MAG: polyprenyl synthetase family protein [Kofleriaceae bacterium]|nr:polyprenyl synthetase family protein [Kofleriaceae bacterium]MBP6838189.1 polyprenyl synthetase family protein [Kofleriaceae bacterium]
MSTALPFWPPAGPIDLARHDLPHPAADTEWWYVNSHLVAEDGRTFSLFAAFFRIIEARDEATGAPSYAHSMTWALSDVAGQRYLAESRVDSRAPELGQERIKNGRGAKDDRLNRAMLEVLEQGLIPVPDRVFDGAVSVPADRLDLDYAGARFTRRPDGSYHLHLDNPRDGSGCDLVFTPRKPATRHGDDGVVRGTGGEQMFYYFVPRCAVTGSVTVDGVALPVATASSAGWYDHEFGGYVAEKATPAPALTHGSRTGEAPLGEGAGVRNLGWNWTAVQLDDGTDLSAYEIVDVDSRDTVGKWLIVVDADGQRREVRDVVFEPGTTWTSARTFHAYPVQWRVRAPSIGLDLTVDAAFADQELITVISKPAFWEGRCQARGTLGGRVVAGAAYIERSGFEDIDDLDDFFSAVGAQVRHSVGQVLPRDPSYAALRDLIASEELDHYMEGVDPTSMAATLIAPIRDIVDRGGKSWRSYAALACCDVVGGDSRKFVQWLAMPELMHVGSLIVDDVQDRSTVRRGGPTCHVVYGEPVAINAGTAAYFLTQKLLISDEVDAERKLRLYDLYFAAMRAGHAGQAIDLGGMAALMPAAVTSGDATTLQARILACHRLKTAAPAGCLARMGAVAGGGTDAQVAAVGEFFEALGLAFQIVDDVLNLRGFKGDLKQRGEDIRNGTVTLPVAVAMGRLDRDRRAWLWSTLQSKPSDERVVAEAVELLESCGAISACADQARAMVEDGWQRAAPLLEPSIARVMLRAFGWYILERHY